MRRSWIGCLFPLVICFLCRPSQAANAPLRTKLDTATCITITFDDGDSFSCNGEQIRVLGIDAPEIKHPRHGTFEDQKKVEAAALTERLLRAAKRVVIVRGGTDPTTARSRTY